MLVGDFNAEESEPCLSQFLYEYNAKNIVKENTCVKNALNPSCIDLFITNSPLSFQNTIAVSNGLSDFHKMVITVMKMSFKKHSPIERHYRDYKYFDRTKFKNNLNEKLSEGISNYESFETTFIEVLNKHAPLRKHFKPLSASPSKWSNTLKQFVGNLPTNCLSVFDHFVKLALKELKVIMLHTLQKT